MPWKPMMLRGQRVLVRTNDAGLPVADQGRVEIRYKPNDGRAYRALIGNLSSISGEEMLPDDHCGPASEAPKKEAAASAKPASKGRAGMPSKAQATADIAAHERPAADGAIVAYADGACSGNPGPAGLGVAVDVDGKRKELSEYLGSATNNVAELTAILRVAELFAGDERTIEIRTDSQYSIGVLSKGWKAKANVELIAKVKAALKLVKVRLTYVPGHAGVAGNERADELARVAVVSRATSGWV